MTRNMKTDLINRIESLRTLSQEELNYAISDIVDELLSSRVTIRCKVAEPIGCPVPSYDSKTDGDYSAFLVANNCD